MNHFPFFPKKFRDDEVSERIERFLRPGMLLAAERSLQRLRERGAGAAEVSQQEHRIQVLKALIRADSEVEERLQQYAGAELSAAGPTSSAGNAVSTEFLRPATMTAGRAALNPVPESDQQTEAGLTMPDSEERNSESPW